MPHIRKPGDDKQELIIKIAQKRFGIYGIEKTSMREIAGDLRISKGLLYYYFPDKESIYKAVIEKEQSEFMKKLKTEIAEIHDPAECLRKYVSIRLLYFKTLLNIGRLRSESFPDLRPRIAESMKEFGEVERNIIKEILEKGKKKKIFSIDNISETVSLFMDLLRGLRLTVLRDKKILIIDEPEYSELSHKALAFTELFIKSLKYK
jgi:TetR/AcrR family transcriptional regulator